MVNHEMYRQAVKARQNRGDVVMTVAAHDQTNRRVLNKLQVTEKRAVQPGMKTVAVVQSRGNQSLHPFFETIVWQIWFHFANLISSDKN